MSGKKQLWKTFYDFFCDLIRKDLICLECSQVFDSIEIQDAIINQESERLSELTLPSFEFFIDYIDKTGNKFQEWDIDAVASEFANCINKHSFATPNCSEEMIIYNADWAFSGAAIAEESFAETMFNDRYYQLMRPHNSDASFHLLQMDGYLLSCSLINDVYSETRIF